MDAILFDCDGVLVDTEARANDAMAALISSLGVPTTGPDCRARFQGLSLAAVAEQLARDDGLNLSVSQITEAVEAALSSGVREMPGATELVRRVQANGLATCVASSGSVEKMQLTLSQTGLLPFFVGRLYSTSMVARGKPAPDIFQHAARQLEVDIARCVVIEDSLSGIRAGVASGAQVLALCADDFADPDAAKALGARPVFSHAEVSDLLGLSTARSADP